MTTEPQNLTYDELSEAWELDRAHIEKARKANTELLKENDHFYRDSESGGALRFTPDGQAILAKSLGVELPQELEPQPVAQQQPEIDLPVELGSAMAQDMAKPTAVEFFKRFPSAVASEITRMVRNPTEAEAPLVYGAMQLAMNAVTSPKQLQPSGQEQVQ